MIYNFDELSFQILQIDKFPHKPGRFQVGARPFSALSLRTRGRAVFEIGTKRLVTEPGDLLFLPANTPYEVEYSGGESIVAHLQDCNYFEAERIPMGASPALYPLFQRLLEAFAVFRSTNRAKSLLYEILDTAAASRESPRPPTSAVNSIRYMEAHFSDPNLDISAVCAANFISRSTLQRLFQERLHTSPKQYLIRLRLEAALEILLRGGYSVKEAALSCGFADEKFFSRSFKQRYGFPPSQRL